MRTVQQPFLLLYLAFCLLLSAGFARGQTCDSDGVCDKYPQCTKWKDDGTCERNRSELYKHLCLSFFIHPLLPSQMIMLERCPVSCREGSCKDNHPRCPVWAKLRDECDDNPELRKNCRKSCNFCDVPTDEELVEGGAIIEEDDEIVEPCLDSHDNCKYWADKGEW
eukprot:scaffold3410_cov141-Cylindrotheca_fusiformis.AAC.31